MKRCLILLSIREMQIKTIISYHFTSARTDKKTKTKRNRKICPRLRGYYWQYWNGKLMFWSKPFVCTWASLRWRPGSGSAAVSTQEAGTSNQKAWQSEFYFVWVCFMMCCSFGYSEIDANRSSLESIPVKGRGRKQDWLERI